jgi:hypothetical protein
VEIIFSDIDGVLNCSGTPNPRKLPYVAEPKLVARLHTVLERASILLTWFADMDFPREETSRGILHHSALTDCTVQVPPTLPTLPIELTPVPFMNQIAVLPLPSRHNRSLLPSPL